MNRALLLVGAAVAAILACYDFSADQRTCSEPGGPCAKYDAGDAGAPDGGDAGGDAGDAGDGGDDAGLTVTVCDSNLDCAAVTCTTGCCDTACTGILQVAAGGGHTCALATDGTVRCWGDNTFGQTGQTSGATTLIPATVPGLTGVAEIAAGDLFSCARKSDGTVWCWGANTSDQLGRAVTGSSPQAAPVTGLGGAVQLSLGDNHACVRLANGHVACWGSNGYGQLGDGTNGDHANPTEVCVTGTAPGCTSFANVLEVAVGDTFTCARVQDGATVAVYCWGDAQSGQLGPSFTNIGSNQPVKVTGLGSAERLSAGPLRACAVVAGLAWCWGQNQTGSGNYTLLGRGNAAAVSDPTPQPVCIDYDAGGCGEVLRAVEEVAIGATFDCARADGGIWCWGENNTSQLGSTSATACSAVALPADAKGGVLRQPFGSLSSKGYHSCAQTPEQGAWCWGGNASGELGNGESGGAASETPTRPKW